LRPTFPDIDPQEVLSTLIERVSGEIRSGQATMIQEIASAISRNEHRVIQAGTGTGKSLGYLIPSATFALSQPHGAVIVSTATLALQRQLLEKDLPILAEVLANNFGASLKYAVLKGRSNYVCLQKLHSTIPDPDQESLFEIGTSALGVQAIAVREWAESTNTGDRDEYPEEIDARVWRGFSVSRRECIGESKCTFGEDCFAAKRRTYASDAHIVVTNHALLAIDVIEGIPVLPDHQVVIIDEGHEIVDRATSAITSELSVGTVERAVSAASSLVDMRTTQLSEDAVSALQVALETLGGGSENIVRLMELPPILIEALTLIRDSLGAAITDISSIKSDQPDVTAKNQRIRGGLEEIHDIAGSILNNGLAHAESHVVWIDHFGKMPVVHSAPLSVAAILESALFSEKCVVVTSATLTTAGNFDAVTKSLGIYASSRLETIDVGSPFDYPTQGILYVAAHLDPPSREGISMEALDDMGELVEAADGRSLILCSSWRAVERASEYLRVRVNTPILVQRRGESAGLLVDRFAHDPEISLIGTLTLWQGVDVPGSSCSQVIIDRIPFPRPDDPVMSARARAVDAAGGSGFSAVTLAKAGLLLAQASGRLIRSSTDRGVVSVLDSRLATARYGAGLRASMPPLWFTTNKDSTLSALQRLAKEAKESKAP
jgi:ATP-dependent DNA helicase DinG